jgi:hypothetical protein
LKMATIPAGPQVIVQVRYTKSYNTDARFSVKPTRKLCLERCWTIRETIEYICSETRQTHPEEKAIYVPSNDLKQFGTWLTNQEKTVADYNLKDFDILELKRRPQLALFGLWSSLGDLGHPPWLLPPPFSETKVDETVNLALDWSEPLKEVIPVFAELFPNGIKKGEDYIFQHLWTEDGQSKRKWLNTNMSLEEQELVPGCLLLITPVSLFLRRPLGTIKHPEKAGFLMKQSMKADTGIFDKSSFLLDKSSQLMNAIASSGSGVSGSAGDRSSVSASSLGLSEVSSRASLGKKTSTKKRWFLLEDNLLYYYQNKSANLPSGILALEYTSITELQNLSGPSGQKFMFELILNPNSFSGKVAHYIIFDENEAQVREWMKVLRYKCSNCSDKRVFEVPISKVMKQTKGQIPNLIVKTVKYIEEKAMDVEGIFRKSGSMIQVQKYRDLYDLGEDPDLNECSDPHTVAGVLKLYLRTLPEPLMTFDLYEAFQAAAELENPVAQVQRMKELVNSLPMDNKVVLNFLIDFIGRVSAHSQQNFMTISNMSTVFGPNLLRGKSDSAAEIMGHTASILSAIEIIIARRDEIFADVRVEIAALEAKREEEQLQAITLPPSRPQSRAGTFSEMWTPDFLPIPSLPPSSREGMTPLEAAKADLEQLELRLIALARKLSQEVQARKQMENYINAISVSPYEQGH